MIVNVFEIPLQPNAFDGVTVIVATTGDIPAFVTVKAGILPAPLAANPMEGVLLVHEKVVPTEELPKVIAFCKALLQSTESLTVFTVVSGLTVIVNVFAGPEQPFSEGVTVIVAVKTVVPILVRVKGFIFPVPDVASPIAILLLVQL